MNRKGLAILMRTRMRPSSTSDPTSKINLSSPFPSPNEIDTRASNNSSKSMNSTEEVDGRRGTSSRTNDFELVKDLMRSAISLNKAEVLDPVLNEFSQGYYGLCYEDRRELLLILAKDYDLDRVQVRQLMKQYLGLQLPTGEESRNSIEGESMLSIFYRTERNLRQALKPMYDDLFDRLNTHSGGLKFLSVVRADILSILADENYASMRALDSYLKEKLITWLSPASLELHRITWDDPASLLEKIVAYEAVHPISSLLDLKRRLGVGRRCFGYLHPAIPGEPLIFIEVALLKDVALTIQEVLWDDPPILEREATCALFYSISSTQPGLAGINLGKFLIKRVIHLVKGEMPHISTFATLSPIPGFMRWLLSKLASQAKLAEEAETTETSNAASAFQESILLPEEERELVNASGELTAAGGNKGGGMEVLRELLNSRNYEWTKSDRLVSAARPALMRLCARYLIHEKKRGKALDSVANFHLQNGAMIEKLNWMADRSDKGLAQSGGIMVNYVYKLENIEENAQAYFNYGHVNASAEMPIT